MFEDQRGITVVKCQKCHRLNCASVYWYACCMCSGGNPLYDSDLIYEDHYPGDQWARTK